MPTPYRRSDLPFLVGGTPECNWLGTSWDVINEAIVCPKCHTDESGIAGMIDPHELIGRWAKLRDLDVRILDYYGGNTFRAIGSDDITRTVGILQLTDLDLPELKAAGWLEKLKPSSSAEPE